MQGGYFQRPDHEVPHQEQLGSMRRYIGTEDHMQSSGMSAPMYVGHGYGRKHIIPQDHHVTREDHIGDAFDPRLTPSRRLIVPQDHLKSDILKPMSDIAAVKVPTTDDMKGAIRDWLITVHNMFVCNEAKWESEVTVEPKGCHWVIEALTAQKKSVSREGPSARIIAEKMSMMPGSELTHFGIRFAGRNDPQPMRREKRGTFEDNRSLVSPGIQDALTREGRLTQRELPTMSCNRKHPEDVQRRYISSGQAHWKSMDFQGGDRPGSHGRARDDDFHEDGLEHGIGHGKRFIGTKDHLIGGGIVAER
jgi:hypothetical protein